MIYTLVKMPDGLMAHLSHLVQRRSKGKPLTWFSLNQLPKIPKTEEALFLCPVQFLHTCQISGTVHGTGCTTTNEKSTLSSERSSSSQGYWLVKKCGRTSESRAVWEEVVLTLQCPLQLPGTLLKILMCPHAIPRDSSLLGFRCGPDI